MTNLTNAASLFRKLVPLFGFIAILIILILLIFIKYGQKTQPQLPITPHLPPQVKILPGVTSGFNTQNLNTPKNYPQTLPAYEYSQPADLVQNANLFALRLGFTTTPVEVGDINVGQGLIYSQENKILGIYENTISYQASTQNPPTIQIDQQTLIAKTQDFLINFDSTLPTQNPNVTYSKAIGEVESEVQDPNEANIINLDFNQDLSTYKLIGTTQVHISFNGNGEITAFNLHPIQIGNTTPSYKLIDYEQALNMVKQNQGSLVSIKGNRENIETTTILGPVSLQNTYLAYYYPQDYNQLIQPVWAFDGSAKIQDLEVKVQYILPAFEFKNNKP